MKDYYGTTYIKHWPTWCGYLYGQGIISDAGLDAICKNETLRHELDKNLTEEFCNTNGIEPVIMKNIAYGKTSKRGKHNRPSEGVRESA